jgi:Zn-dependent protease with chaperone function
MAFCAFEPAARSARTVSAPFVSQESASAATTAATQPAPSAELAQTVPSSTAAHPSQSGRITEYKLAPELHKKAHLFSRIRFGSRLFGVLYGLLILWLVLQRRSSARFRDWAENVSRRRFVQAIVYTPILVLSVVLLQLPLDVFDEATFKHYGVSVQSWPSWAGDWAKVQGLTCVIGSFLAWILYAVIRKSPRRWWLVFWLISIPLVVFFFFAAPIVFDPMFNRFEPLSAKAPQLIPELQQVCRRAGLEIPTERMFWMEASNKSVVPNAYVTGIGASKRIVVWDTTIAQETTDGLLTTFGHELGHYVLGHVWKAVVLFTLALLMLLYLGFRTIGWLLELRGAAWGIRGLDDWASLPALLLLISAFGFVAGVAGNAISRYLANQADIYSLEVTRGIVADPGQASAISFQKFGEKVFVDPDPNPLNVFLFFDHPTVADRIRLFATYDPWAKGEPPQYVK